MMLETTNRANLKHNLVHHVIEIKSACQEH